MAALLSAEVIGNVGREPQERFTGDGVRTLNFSVAVNDKGKDGPTEWVECTLWDKRAEKVGPYITKGKQVWLRGRPGARSYVAEKGKNAGQLVTVLTLSVHQVELLGSRQDAERSPLDPPRPAQDDYDIGSLEPPQESDFVNYGGAGGYLPPLSSGD